MTKKKRYMWVIIVCTVAFLPLPAAAQGTLPPPPPPGREESPMVPVEPEPVELVRTQTASDTGAQVYVSDFILGAMGLTRTQFVDRIAAGMFQGDDVDLLIPRFYTLTPRVLHGAGGGLRIEGDLSGEDRLVAVQVRQFYQIPRYHARPEEIDTLDQLYLTDGTVYVEIRFRSAAQVIEK